MLDKIEHVGNDWNYLHDNYQYTRITFFNEYMKVKSVSLKDIGFTVLYEEEPTIDKIKTFFQDGIKENWNMDMKNFKNNYENLVELVLYDDCLIMLKFKKEKYYNLFNIEKGHFFMGIEELFAPFSLSLTIEYTTFSDKTEKDVIEFVFKNYIEDFLVIRKVISGLLTIRTEPFLAPDYIILLANDEENKVKNK